MRKIYVLDTSILIYDPNSFKNFAGNDVFIPINVLDELDKIKTFTSDAGKNARICIRALDALCEKKDINKGIKIENDITLKIETKFSANEKIFGAGTYADNRILACAYALKQKNAKKKIPTILVSKDINLRIRARAFNIEAQDYLRDKIDVSDIYTGYKNIVNDDIGEVLIQCGSVFCNDYEEIKDLHQNECVHVESKDGRGLAVGRRVGDQVKIIKNRKVWGLSSRSKEQAYAIDLLCDKNVPLVTLTGRAGSGKTVIAVASALECVLERKEYAKIIVYRPVISVGKQDIGFLPGSIDEKLGPWMESINDAFEVLFSSSKGDKWKTMFDLYKEKEIINLEALAYIRGRSIPKTFILIEEGQNLSKEEMKTILTRVGTDTKVVITGDIEQIDNSYLDATNNGLSYVIEKFKDSELAGHVTFTKGERSLLATKASEIL